MLTLLVILTKAIIMTATELLREAAHRRVGVGVRILAHPRLRDALRQAHHERRPDEHLVGVPSCSHPRAHC